jgi:predicted MFS family arabinose efflux permease
MPEPSRLQESATNDGRFAAGGGNRSAGRDDSRKVALPLGLLAAAGFLSAAGARVVDPLLDVMARDFRTDVADVSGVVAAFTLLYGLNQILLGPAGDRFGKLRVLLFALFGYVLATGACALAPDLPWLVVLRGCAGAASAGLIPTCLAYIGDNVPYGARQVTLSRFLTGIVLAQAMAGPIGGAFGDTLGWRGVFALLAGGALLVGLLLARRIGRLPPIAAAARPPSLAAYGLLLRRPDARRLLLATFAEGAALAGSFPFLAPYLRETFGLSYLAVGLILSCFAIGALAYTRAARRLLAAFGEEGLVLTGGMLLAGAMAIGMTLDAWWPFVAIEIALGLGYFMLHSVMQARATELLPDARATAVSAFVFMLFLGQSAGALAVGAIIGRHGYPTAFRVDAAFIAAISVFLFFYMRRTR